MSVVDFIINRRSNGKVGEPAPPPDVVQRAIAAAVAAPDHGRLRPWEFILIEGDARAKLGGIMADGLLARDPQAPEAMVAKARNNLLRAPLIIVVVAKVHVAHPKIPEIEQVLATGAAAENLILALHAEGYGCVWRTGAPSYDPAVKAALGLRPSDQIVGFVYVGTPIGEPTPVPRPDAGSFIRRWT